ncbi:unnamed protein product [Mucor hiemalis]
METLGISLADFKNQPYFDYIINQHQQIDQYSISFEVTNAIKNLWQDEGVRETQRRSNEFQLKNSAPYDLDSIKRIGDQNYMHTDQDVLRSRVKTTGIAEIAIPEYDQVLIEDETVNRMQKALTLFDSICNSRWFEKTSTILFLNKLDLFKQKLLTSPLNAYFPDYQGGDDYELASYYLMQRFISLYSSPEKQA